MQKRTKIFDFTANSLSSSTKTRKLNNPNINRRIFNEVFLFIYFDNCQKCNVIFFDVKNFFLFFRNQINL